MTTAFGLIVQLLPVLAGHPTAGRTDTLPEPAVPAPAPPLISRGWVDWDTLGRPPRELADTPVARPRTRAIEYGSGYHTRLKLHRILSFVMIPFFIGSYVTGDKLIHQGNEAPGWARSLHGPFAAGTAVLFSANTITGLWNLWESRKDPAGRTKRWVHSLLFIAADAGFTYAGLSAPESEEGGGSDEAGTHRTVALVSMGVSVTSWGMMLLFK